MVAEYMLPATFVDSHFLFTFIFIVTIAEYMLPAIFLWNSLILFLLIKYCLFLKVLFVLYKALKISYVSHAFLRNCEL